MLFRSRSARNSPTVLAGCLAVTARSKGTSTSTVTGMKSFSGSSEDLNRNWLITMVLEGTNAEGVAVGRRECDGLHADLTPAPGSVLDDHGLLQSRFDPWARGGNDGVDQAAGTERVDEPDRLGGPLLRLGSER